MSQGAAMHRVTREQDRTGLERTVLVLSTTADADDFLRDLRATLREAKKKGGRRSVFRNGGPLGVEVRFSVV